MGAFQKKRKKPIGIMTDKTVDLYNSMVDKLSKHIENLLSINRDYRFQKIDLLNFADHFDIKIDTDSQGQVYPDISVKFEKEPSLTGKKEKKK